MRGLGGNLQTTTGGNPFAPIIEYLHAGTRSSRIVWLPSVSRESLSARRRRTGQTDD
jgi:hypothetical protein